MIMINNDDGSVFFTLFRDSERERGGEEVKDKEKETAKHNRVMLPFISCVRSILQMLRK